MKIKLTNNFKIFLTILFLVFGIIALSRFISYFRENIRLFEPPEDPRVTKIKQDIILPLCETKGNITEENISDFFSAGFSEFYNRKEAFDWDKMQRYTPITAAQEKYTYMFVEYMDIKDCKNYLRKIKDISFGEYIPLSESDKGRADYQLIYYPSKGVKISATLKYENGDLKIRSVGRTATVQINPFD